jgi:hypothetical protein
MLLTALAFHLHYTGILILLGEAVVLLGYYLVSRKPVPYRPWRAAFDWQIAVMLCLPAIGHVLKVVQRREMWDSMSGKPAWSDLLTVFPLYPSVLLAGSVAILAIVQRFQGSAAAKPQASWAALSLIAVWLLVPLLAAFAIAHLDVARLFLRRYLIAFTIGPSLLTALLSSRLPRCWLQGVAAAIMLCLAIGQSGIIAQLRYDGRAVGDRNEDWRGALAWLRQEYAATGGDVEVYGGLIEEDWSTGLPLDVRLTPSVAEYLRFPIHSLYPAPQPKPSEESVRWTVTRGRGKLRRYWEAFSYDCLEEREFGDVIVTQWRPERRQTTSPQFPATDP